MYLEDEEGFCSQELVISLTSLFGLMVKLSLPEERGRQFKQIISPESHLRNPGESFSELCSNITVLLGDYRLVE